MEPDRQQRNQRSGGDEQSKDTGAAAAASATLKYFVTVTRLVTIQRRGSRVGHDHALSVLGLSFTAGYMQHHAPHLATYPSFSFPPFLPSEHKLSLKPQHVATVRPWLSRWLSRGGPASA